MRGGFTLIGRNPDGCYLISAAFTFNSEAPLTSIVDNVKYLSLSFFFLASTYNRPRVAGSNNEGRSGGGRGSK